jgi:nucleotidyltransferase substrate binding protein (TIGR01987 family)
MELKDIRWKLATASFQNFEKALHHLNEALDINEPDIIRKAGLIQFFEMTFELAWNLMKDYLEEQGYMDIVSPRAVIKKAFEVGLITEGHRWLKLLEDRNLTSHTYDEQKASDVEQLIRGQYHPLLQCLDETMREKLS